MIDYFFVLQYGQWLILVISILALYQVSSVNHETRLKGYLVTALSRFSGAVIFLFVDLVNAIITHPVIRNIPPLVQVDYVILIAPKRPPVI